MVPRIVVYYVAGEYEKSPGEKIAKAAFVNEGDALVFWNALSENRKKYFVMETANGEPVKEIAHSGFIGYSGSYGHAVALTASRPLPPRERDRVCAEKDGWKFERIAD